MERGDAGLFFLKPVDPLPQKRILVVDYDPVVRGLMVVALEDAGHCVETAEDDEVAWDAMLANTYDMLVTDDISGRVSSLATARHICVMSCIDYLQS